MAELLTTNQVQELLSVDRTTIYRMAQGGQLPAIRVGKQWRFDRAHIDHWLRSQTAPGTSASVPVQAPAPVAGTPALANLLPLASLQLVQDAFAEALGVMMVVTDMEGRPVTQVSNACGMYDAVIGDAEAATRCIQDWQRMAGVPTMEPKFAPSDLGLLCTRGLIRSGNELKGMVLLGGIAPEEWPPAPDRIDAIAAHYGLDPERVRDSAQSVHRLDGQQHRAWPSCSGWPTSARACSRTGATCRRLRPSLRCPQCETPGLHLHSDHRPPPDRQQSILTRLLHELRLSRRDAAHRGECR
jgi:excisionase family DNA binding protein